MCNAEKVALVTGALRGIGRAVALRLRADGYQVVITGTRSPEAAAGDLAGLEAGGIRYIRANNKVDADRERAVQQVMEWFGRIDVLVNNAGMAPRERRDILEMTPESYDEVMDVNCRGAFFMTQRVAGIMAQQKSGCIVTISSISAEAISLNRGEYCMSKAALSMATQLFAARLAPLGIGVYEIRPGVIETDMTSGVHDKYDALIEGGLIPNPRWGKPEDIAKAVSMLASGALAYANGQVIQLDGGLHIPQL